MGDFQGKVALIVGGSSGIGAATARLLAQQGASVVVNFRSKISAAQQLVEEIRANGGAALVIQADIQEAANSTQLVETARSTYGRLDILVYSVTSGVIFKPFAQMNWEEFFPSIQHELRGVFNSTKAVLPLMQEQHYGRIVYIGSGLAKAPQMQGGISLGTAKAALTGFARYIAREYGRFGITANIVAPGMVETNLLAVVPVEDRQRTAAFTPLGRLAQAEDIARVVAFFASAASGFMTGVYAPVNGGASME